MYYIDEKYVFLLGSQLSRFRRINDNTFNCRCPICGDSKKNKSKARGFFLRYNNTIVYKCHNCGYAGHISAVLKTLNPALYDEYQLENLTENSPQKAIKPKEERAPVPKTSLNIPKITELDKTHEARVYCEGRQLVLEELYYADNFAEWAKLNFGEKYSKLKKEPRIVIPFMTKNCELLAAQGRSLLPNDKLRYITLKSVETKQVVYGLHNWEHTKETFIVEGPLDSLFLPNSLAVATSDLVRVKKAVPNLIIDKTVFIYDNQPRNKEIIKMITKAVNNGYKVFFWPDTVTTKDINDFVLDNSKKELLEMVSSNVYQGLAAEMKLSEWRKV